MLGKIRVSIIVGAVGLIIYFTIKIILYVRNADRALLEILKKVSLNEHAKVQSVINATIDNQITVYAFKVIAVLLVLFLVLYLLKIKSKADKEEEDKIKSMGNLFGLDDWNLKK